MLEGMRQRYARGVLKISDVEGTSSRLVAEWPYCGSFTAHTAQWYSRSRIVVQPESYCGTAGVALYSRSRIVVQPESYY